MRTSKIIVGAGLSVLAAAVGPQASGAFISESGTGWVPYEADYSASLRHVKGNAQDFEIGLGSNPSGFAAIGQSSWNQGDNSFVLSFDAVTKQVSLALNGSQATWAAPASPTGLTIQLIARNQNKNHHAELSLSGLTFNGAPVDTARAGASMKASDMPGTDAPGQFTWVMLQGLAGRSWTLGGTLKAGWTGPAPERSYTRMDVGFQTPEPGPLAIMVVAGASLFVRRRHGVSAGTALARRGAV